MLTAKKMLLQIESENGDKMEIGLLQSPTEKKKN